MIKKNINLDHLAKLTNLIISQEEKKFLARQLQETVDYIEILQELDTSNVLPVNQVAGHKNVAREDKPTRGLTQREALANAPKQNGGYFVAPRIKWE